MIDHLNSGKTLGSRSILSRVPSKPFATNYRIPTPDGYVVINGEQVVKIDAKKEFAHVGLSSLADALNSLQHGWRLTFYLSDGSTHIIAPSLWTKNFVNDVFDVET
jgi:hypothetical protein